MKKLEKVCRDIVFLKDKNLFNQLVKALKNQDIYPIKFDIYTSDYADGYSCVGADCTQSEYDWLNGFRHGFLTGLEFKNQ